MRTNNLLLDFFMITCVIGLIFSAVVVLGELATAVEVNPTVITVGMINAILSLIGIIYGVGRTSKRKRKRNGK